LDRRLGGLQSWSGHGGEEKNFQPLPGLEPPIIQYIAQRYAQWWALVNMAMNLRVPLNAGNFLIS
jgi:hypothetical protein